ncbi:hypothetical protein BV20DRAFT_183936 [Pilatotrama ljubarskyi]|nr:hypothetical protein BV20DRAFT_183936 [Pilatotrama ljubarskyi]
MARAPARVIRGESSRGARTHDNDRRTLIPKPRFLAKMSGQKLVIFGQKCPDARRLGWHFTCSSHVRLIISAVTRSDPTPLIRTPFRRSSYSSVNPPPKSQKGPPLFLFPNVLTSHDVSPSKRLPFDAPRPRSLLFLSHALPWPISGGSRRALLLSGVSYRL